MKSVDEVWAAGWGISNGWQIGGENPNTGQVGWASDANVKIVPGAGLTLTVPGGKSLISYNQSCNMAYLLVRLCAIGQNPTGSQFTGAEITFPWVTLGQCDRAESWQSSG